MDYKYIAESYNELHFHEQYKKLMMIIDKFPEIRNEKVLDVGCGTAFYCGWFEKYTGLDNSEEMIGQSKKKLILGRAENLPFDDKSFDIVISLSAINNFDDPSKAVSEMKRVSRGKIIITVFKRSKNYVKIEKLLEDFDRIEEDKDMIFYKRKRL